MQPNHVIDSVADLPMLLGLDEPHDVANLNRSVDVPQRRF
jgi:hypothetical protein